MNTSNTVSKIVLVGLVLFAGLEASTKKRSSDGTARAAAVETVVEDSRTKKLHKRALKRGGNLSAQEATGIVPVPISAQEATGIVPAPAPAPVITATPAVMAARATAVPLPRPLVTATASRDHTFAALEKRLGSAGLAQLLSGLETDREIILNKKQTAVCAAAAPVSAPTDTTALQAAMQPLVDQIAELRKDNAEKDAKIIELLNKRGIISSALHGIWSHKKKIFVITVVGLYCYHNNIGLTEIQVGFNEIQQSVLAWWNTDKITIDTTSLWDKIYTGLTKMTTGIRDFVTGSATATHQAACDYVCPVVTNSSSVLPTPSVAPTSAPGCTGWFC